MRVLKVVLEGLTTSFRYPHFMLTPQPSFLMPPPATIYGHICSALGEWVEPDSLAFAYHFTSQGSAEDLEHVHVLSASTGKLPGSKVPKVLEGNVNPFQRTILFKPRLVLYLNRPDWFGAFHSPYYPVVLGRSQDLCWYSSVEVLDLQPRERVRFEHTLLPPSMATQTAAGVVVLMPRWLNYRRDRQPTFARYLLLQRRIDSAELLYFGSKRPTSYLADPTITSDGVPLGLHFHTFTGGDDDAISLA
jgi:CRISPR-associated protein Cas5t